MTSTTKLPPPPPLAQLTTTRKIALFLDFDGTLVEIAPSPDAIRVPPGMADTLRTLAARLDGRLAIVSGRSIEDLWHHCPLQGIACAGSHGQDRRDTDGTALGPLPVGLPEEAIRALEHAAGAMGIAFEPKRHGMALHYRARPEMGPEAVRVAGVLATQYGLAIKQGKSVVELTQHGADKGDAVRGFLAEPVFAGAVPVFVGDDITDEDGVAASISAGGFGVIVGDRRPTAAQFGLSGVEAVHQWLNL